jgi:Methylase involved in ubiquinone/menaquinone biosynthesis
MKATIKKIFKFFLCSYPDALNEIPRIEWVRQALTALPAGQRILDAGAGELRYKKFCNHLKYVAQDFGQYEGHGNEKGLHTGTWNQSKLDIVSDITAIPEPDASFDAILCAEVLEHLPDPLLALKEFSRLLRPGGSLILTAPFASFVHFAPYFFNTGFSEYWYRRHLPATGFEIVDLQANGNFSEFMLQETTRIAEIAKRYCPSIKPTLLDKIGLRLVINLLCKMQGVDKSSHEFVCFGYHIIAKKK